MTDSSGPAPPPERCWFCDQPILRGETTRIVPNIGLVVHARCYESATAPPRSSDPR
jgi:hypothetical protein